MPDIISIPDITALYAGLLAIIGIALSAVCIATRRKLRINLGDGGNDDMLLAMRRQANFVEYVPMALILIALVEMNGAPDYAIHGLGLVLLAARVAHAFGLSNESGHILFRGLGAAVTALVTMVAAIWNIYLFVV